MGKRSIALSDVNRILLLIVDVTDKSVNIAKNHVNCKKLHIFCNFVIIYNVGKGKGKKTNI